MFLRALDWEMRTYENGAGGGGVVAVPQAAPPVHAGRRRWYETGMNTSQIVI